MYIETIENLGMDNIKETERLVIRTATKPEKMSIEGSKKNQRLQGFNKVNSVDHKFKKQWSELLKSDKNDLRRSSKSVNEIVN